MYKLYMSMRECKVCVAMEEVDLIQVCYCYHISFLFLLLLANEFGLFKPDEDPTKGRWLEQGRTLEYYDLKSGDMLQYRKKLRPLRVRTLDGSVKTLLVDDSQTVAELIKTVCAKIGKTARFFFHSALVTPSIYMFMCVCVCLCM